MFNRIKQFTKAVMAVAPNDDEMAMIKDLIPQEAVDRFLQLTVADQRHSLNVMYTAEKLSSQNDCHVNTKLLRRCALLHDIGRGGDMTTMKKTLSVLMDKFLHKWSVARGDMQHGLFGEMLHRYYHHGEISAEMLREIGLIDEADIVELHHVPADRLRKMSENDNKVAASSELKLLILADSLN